MWTKHNRKIRLTFRFLTYIIWMERAGCKAEDKQS